MKSVTDSGIAQILLASLSLTGDKSPFFLINLGFWRTEGASWCKGRITTISRGLILLPGELGDADRADCASFRCGCGCCVPELPRGDVVGKSPSPPSQEHFFGRNFP